MNTQNKIILGVVAVAAVYLLTRKASAATPAELPVEMYRLPTGGWGTLAQNPFTVLDPSSPEYAAQAAIPGTLEYYDQQSRRLGPGVMF